MINSKKSGTLARREMIEGYLFISPWIIGFIVFIAGPLCASLILSFCEWGFLSPPKLIGTKNYINLFEKDPLFLQSLRVTLRYVLISVPLGTVGSLLLAILMNQKLKCISLFRTAYYLPAVVSGVAIALVWMWVFNADFGILNYLLGKLGIVGPRWLFSRTWGLPALIIINVWKLMPSNMIIYLVGLQSIPEHFYEAAEIDGANWWVKFWKITLPLITPIIFFNLVINLINSFQMFTESYVMTGGGPANATLSYGLYLYRVAFEYFDMGYACALAWVLFVIILLCTLLVLKSSPFWVYYEAEVRGYKQ